ncbi:MAG: hypothetical protein AB7F75_00395 [Planctomycetota bacterium]
MKSLQAMLLSLLLGVVVYVAAPVEWWLQREDIGSLSTGRHWSYGVNRLAFMRVEAPRHQAAPGDPWIFGSSIGNSLFPPSVLGPTGLALYYPYGRPLVLDPWMPPGGLRWIFLIDPQMLLGPVVPTPCGDAVWLEARRELWRLAMHSVLPGPLGSEEESMRLTLLGRKSIPDRGLKRSREIQHLIEKMRTRGVETSLESDLHKLVEWNRGQLQCGGSLKVVILPVTAEFRETRGSCVEDNLLLVRHRLNEGGVELLDLSDEPLREEQLVDWGHYDGWNPLNQRLQDRILGRTHPLR